MCPNSTHSVGIGIKGSSCNQVNAAMNPVSIVTGCSQRQKTVIQVTSCNGSRVQPTEGLEISKGVLQVTSNSNGSRVQPKGHEIIQCVEHVQPSRSIRKGPES